MKKINLFVCVLALCSLSLMAVKLDIEIEEKSYNYDRKIDYRKTILKETVHIEKGDFKAHICENSDGIGVEVRVNNIYSGGEIWLNVWAPYKRLVYGGTRTSKKKTLADNYFLIGAEVGIDKGPALFEFSNLKDRKKLKVFVVKTSD